MDEWHRKISDSLGGYVTSLPARARAGSDSLSRRIRVRESSPAERWTDQFTPITLLYPYLQAEGESEVSDEIGLAHVLLLIQNFVDDRQYDGQLRLTDDESLFVRISFVDAVSIIMRAAMGNEACLTELTSLLKRYVHSQSTAYMTGLAKPTEIGYRSMRRIVPARGYMAFAATLVHLYGAHGDGKVVRVAKNAFDSLMIALQWVDDMEDWREDVAMGDENLLLAALRERGRDAYGHPANAVREANVGHALVEEGVFALAVENARKWFEFAARRQRALRCGTLAGLIEERIARLPAKRERIESDIETEVLARLIASQVAAEPN